MAEVYYGFNFNQPVDGANFIAGVGSSGKRANEFSLNLGSLELNLDPEPLGARLVLYFGNGTEILHMAEIAGEGVGAQVWRFIGEASLSYRAPIGHGLIFTGGIFPSHLGLEVLPSQDNWNYTHSWAADLAASYQTGIRVSYPFTKHLSAQLHLVNGWNVVADNNAAKSVGVQLQWNSERVLASFNGLFGPEQTDDNRSWRLFFDSFAVLKPLRWLHLAALFDVGLQQRPAGDQAWYGAEGYLRLLPTARFALALRGGVFHDPNGVMTGTAQTVGEATGTLELRPTDGLSLKLEGRYDRSSAAVFGTRERAADGMMIRSKDQALIILGAVAAF